MSQEHPVEIEDHTLPRVFTQRQLEAACQGLVLEWSRGAGVSIPYEQGLVLERSVFELVRSVMREA